MLAQTIQTPMILLLLAATPVAGSLAESIAAIDDEAIAKSEPPAPPTLRSVLRYRSLVTIGPDLHRK